MLASSIGNKLGVLSELIGVGIATIWNFASFNLDSFEVKSIVDYLMVRLPTSFVGLI